MKTEIEKFHKHFDKHRYGMYRLSIDSYLEHGIASGSFLTTIEEHAKELKLVSDQQNKELREKLEISFSHATLTKLNLEAEIQRLTKELQELKQSKNG